MTAALFSTRDLRNYEVYDRAGDKLGKIVDVMLSIEDARVRYAVLDFVEDGGDHRLIAVPLTGLRLDTENECFVLGIARDALAAVPGFCRDDPPEEPETELQGRGRPSVRGARPGARPSAT
jgi:hypothetical protein